MKKFQPLLEKYENNRVIRGLIQLIPFGIGGAVDVVLTKTIEKIQEERANTFFDELSSGNIVVDERLLESEDFLHAYFSTAKYALNTRRREKIRMFANLLKSSLIESEISDIDEYEDYLNVLDELSYRELLALNMLDKYSLIAKENGQNDLQRTGIFWEEFENRLSQELHISTEQVPDFMNRIARTGCYEMFTGSYLGYTGGRGKLTPTFKKLKQFIKSSNSTN